MSTIRIDAITAVVVVGSRVAPIEVFRNLATCLARASVDYEIVILANDVPADTAQRLVALADAVANVTVHFLAQRIDRDTAALLGIDQALGDWVVILTPTAEEIECLPTVLDRAGPYQVIFAGAPNHREFPFVYRTLVRGYFRLFEIVSRSAIDWPAPRIRVYSRAAARYLTSLVDGEFALRSLNFSGAFPGTRVEVSNLPCDAMGLLSSGAALRKAFRGLLGVNAVALRAVVGIALVAASVAVCSSIYALLVYLLKENVAPGWTTLSLQISTMMLLFSVMFTLLAEYVLNVYRAMAPRRRIVVVREIRSPLRTEANRLNVIGADGILTSNAFALGAPADQLMPAPKVGIVR
jgi:polyisoprenyl-phosphate glycosyltransferase